MEKINVIVLSAGLGVRFSKHKITTPKPLIDVKGYCMINWASRNVLSYNNFNKFIYLIRDDLSSINSDLIQQEILTLKSDSIIIKAKDNLDGPVITSLKAKSYINNDTPLIIANCDMFLENFNLQDFILKVGDDDGGIVVFEEDSKSNKYSYVSIDEKGLIDRVAEKQAISNLATVGLYYWKRGRDFVDYADKMIKKNIRVINSEGVGEFYVCPVYQEAIDDNKKIIAYKIPAKDFHNLGDPESLELFLK